MINFQYYNPAKIIFGKNSIGQLKDLLRDQAVHSLLMIYTGNFVKTLGIYDAVKSVCAELQINFFEDGTIAKDAPVSKVRQLIEFGKTENVDILLAVGGGAAIDTAKSIALGIPYSGDVWDFFSGKSLPEKVLPVGVISTIAASGSETSNAAILSNGENKIGFEDDRLIPKFAILDPSYTLKLPLYQTACGTADIYSHILERYFSAVEHTDLTDRLLEGAALSLINNGEIIINDSENYDVRAEIMWTASVAHNNLLDTGRCADWGSHRIEHELSAQYNLVHGEGMAVVMPAWIRFAAENKPEKPAQFASRVYHLDPYNMTETERASALADLVERFFRSLGLKTRLSEFGIDDSKFEEMAEQITATGTDGIVGHYIPLDQHRVIDVMKLAL